MSAKPYVYYFDPVALTTGTFICVATCPTTTQLLSDYTSALCRYDQTPTASNYLSLVSSGVCASYTYASSSVLNRCLPTGVITAVVTTANSSTAAVSTSLLTSSMSSTMSILSGIVYTWPVIVVGIGASVFVSLIWLAMMQVIAGLFVWITLAAANLGFLFSAVWLYFYWQNQVASLAGTTYMSGNAAGTAFINAFGISSTNLVDSSTVTYLAWVFYIVAVLAGLLLLFTIAMIKRIKMAVAVIKQASYAMLKMPLIVVGVYIVTPNTVPASVTIGSWSWTNANTQNVEIAIHLFGFLWTLFWLMGINQVTLAGAFASWYWSVDKKARLYFPVMKSFFRTLRYSLGSIAVGSLLIAIVEFIRIVLYQAQRYATKSKSTYLKYLVACLQCCMACVSVMVKFINRNAYIVIAVTGQPFFKSAGHATSLMLKNALRLVAVDFVSAFVLLLSKIIVAVIPSIAAYIYILKNASLYSGVVYPQVSVALIALGSFLIASAFFSVYEMGIDTIFLCFLEDLEKNDGSPERPYYMPDALAKLMGVESVSSPKKTTAMTISPTSQAVHPEKVHPEKAHPTEHAKAKSTEKSRTASVKKVSAGSLTLQSPKKNQEF
ncbi:hypothetical protein HDU91_004600 [Kappamyces sp. JEL0680]|nr:hypothetical protein HDU91_004600 [Kappamyces sp. JEL0680]